MAHAAGCRVDQGQGGPGSGWTGVRVDQGQGGPGSGWTRFEGGWVWRLPGSSSRSSEGSSTTGRFSSDRRYLPLRDLILVETAGITGDIENPCLRQGRPRTTP